MYEILEQVLTNVQKSLFYVSHNSRHEVSYEMNKWTAHNRDTNSYMQQVRITVRSGTTQEKHALLKDCSNGEPRHRFAIWKISKLTMKQKQLFHLQSNTYTNTDMFLRSSAIIRKFTSLYLKYKSILF
jgi:predicted transcriptional regulator